MRMEKTGWLKKIAGIFPGGGFRHAHNFCIIVKFKQRKI